MIPDDKYSGNARENFMQSIQMELSEKPKTFCKIFMAFLKIAFTFSMIWKKDEAYSFWVFAKLLTPKAVVT